MGQPTSRSHEPDPLRNRAACCLQPVAGAHKYGLAATGSRVEDRNRRLLFAQRGRCLRAPVLQELGPDKKNICGAVSLRASHHAFRVPPESWTSRSSRRKTCSSPALAETTDVEVGPDVV